MVDQPVELSLQPFHRSANVDCSFAYMGSVLSVTASLEETGGGLSVMVIHARSGSEPPPHIHHREHELFYILEGTIEFFCEGYESSFVVGQGETVFLPQAKAHAMRFRSAEVRVIAVLHAQENQRTTSEPYFKQMAVGRASSMLLSDNLAQYSTATIFEIDNAIQVAAANGITLLSPAETARRLPCYPGSEAEPSRGGQ
ncbi:MAG: cupin domain-containing protein [Janthinobacterium lividum]